MTHGASLALLLWRSGQIADDHEGIRLPWSAGDRRRIDGHRIRTGGRRLDRDHLDVVDAVALTAMNGLVAEVNFAGRASDVR
jgi:hypothetical protein